ncbi:MAG: DUF1932 domain-containing protein [Desulfuromusa sp.]|nr:DUF1932 domain-containing protein [Desulfuromusa sp.]
MVKRIAFIGMGEAGGAIVSGWGGAYVNQIRAFDIKTDNPATAEDMKARYLKLGVLGTDCPEEAVFEADIIFSTVTADQAVKAASSAAQYLRPGAFWCDLNSCAPTSKQKAAEIIDDHGGRYVDVAVMSPIFPKCNMAPLFISGPYAEEIEPILVSLPMSPRVVSKDVGVASSIKMIRSVFVKGLEALTSECMLAAVAAGVEQEVLTSLEVTHSGINWDAQAAQNFERAMVHGMRRAAEMEEVAKTLTDLGLPTDMTNATVSWQRRIAGVGEKAPENPKAAGVKLMAEILLPRIFTPERRG